MYTAIIINGGMDMDQLTTRVRDLGLAAALVSRGHEISSMSRDDSDRAYFTFAHNDKIDQAVNGYWADTLDVKARRYSDAIKMLKSRIYDER
jgi:hypothetical protein